jgi:hypothetical protein
LNEGLHLILDLFPVIILTVSFVTEKTFAICRAAPEFNLIEKRKKER